MGSHMEQAARITGPISAADPTARRGVTRVALTGAAQNIALPTTGREPGKASTLGSRFIRLLAVGANVQLVESVGAVTVVLNQVAAVGTGNTQAGATYLNGAAESWRLDSATTHLSFISDAAAGFLEFYVSDQPVV